MLLLALLSSSLVASACGGSKSTAPKSAVEKEKTSAAPTGGLEDARLAFLRSDYEVAERQLRALVECQPEATCPTLEARLLLSRVLLLTGRPKQVSELGLSPDAAPSALVLAQAARARGDLKEAGELLSGVKRAQRPDDLQILVLQAELLLELGSRAQAEELLLEKVIPVYGDGSLKKLSIGDRARALTMIGRAAHLLRSAEDANEAYNQAEELEKASHELLLYRAELFIEKYDVPHAAEVLEELLEGAPHHPDALVLMARLVLEERMAFEAAREFVVRARKIDPGHPGAHYVLGSIALKDLDFAEVERHIDAGLERNPRDRELLSLRAASFLLAEDRSSFDKTLDHLLELSPGYARALAIIADHAEWEHRYEEMESLLRRAVRIDPDDARARGMLGLTLVRAGSDNAGVVELRRAFDEDPFSVRVKNTLELYDDILPEHYVTQRHGPFNIRVPKQEAPLLFRYVPELLDEAYRQMKSRYGFEPRAPLSIEIYQTREQFAVRTSGLPQTPIQGVCFGRKLATISPRGSPGNLGMTLWHELAHVFHIGLSRSRVPRWLTEGLAEWETHRLGRGWSRELDRELYQAVRAGRLPELDRMTQAFTHAEEMQDIAVAYYASGKIADFLVMDRGEDRVTRLLQTLGEGKLPRNALPLALDVSTAELDSGFRARLRQDLARYDDQFVSEMTRLSVASAKQAFEDTKTPDARTAFGQALLLEGRVEEAEVELRNAAKDSPQAAYTLARVLLAKGEKQAALDLVKRAIFDRGHDGIEPRLMAAKVELGRGKYGLARRHLERGSELDESEVEVWALLARVAQAQKDADLELAALRGWALRAEHDGDVHRRYVGRLLDAGLLDEARLATKNAIWADLGSATTHALAARVYLRLGETKAARFEWESAQLCPMSSRERERLTTEVADAFAAAGSSTEAREIRSTLPAASADGSQSSEPPPATAPP